MIQNVLLSVNTLDLTPNSCTDLSLHYTFCLVAEAHHGSWSILLIPIMAEFSTSLPWSFATNSSRRCWDKMLLEHQCSNPASRTALSSAPIKYSSDPLLHDTHSIPLLGFFIHLCAFLTLLLTENAPEKAKFGKYFTKRSPEVLLVLCSSTSCEQTGQWDVLTLQCLRCKCQLMLSQEYLLAKQTGRGVHNRLSKQNPSNTTNLSASMVYGGESHHSQTVQTPFFQ